MEPHVALGLEGLTAEDLAALRLSAQVMAHRAALAGLPRVAMFFERLEAEADAEAAARGQRGARSSSDLNPWRVAGMTAADRAAIVDHAELLAANPGLPPAVREYARQLCRSADSA